MEDKRILNYQVEVHTVNRVYVSRIISKTNFIKYRDLDFEKSFWHIYDKSLRISTLTEEFLISINGKEIFLNPKTIEFIEIYKNVNPNKTAKEGVYMLDDYPYKTFYQNEKGLLARLMD